MRSRVAACVLSVGISYCGGAELGSLGGTPSAECSAALETLQGSPQIEFRRILEHLIDSARHGERYDEATNPFDQARASIGLLVRDTPDQLCDVDASADALVAFWECRNSCPSQDDPSHLYYLWRPIPLFHDAALRSRVVQTLQARSHPDCAAIEAWLDQMVLTDEQAQSFEDAEVGDFEDEI